jgi:hypothetical protein
MKKKYHIYSSLETDINITLMKLQSLPVKKPKGRETLI